MTAGRADAPLSAPAAGRTRRRVLGALAALPFLTPAAASALRDVAADDADDNCARECRKRHEGKARKRCKRRCAAGRVCVAPGERGCSVPGGSCCDPGACENNVCACPPNMIPVDGVCTSCTVCPGTACLFNVIKQAVDAAIPGDTIYLCPSVYWQPAPVINKSLTLYGAGAGQTVISVRPLTFEPDAQGVRIVNETATVEFRNLTIRNGIATPIGFSAVGAGINNVGTLRLYGVEVTRNTTVGRGGGIVNFGTLTIGAGTRIVQNSSAVGGGVFNFNRVIREPGSEIAGNTPDQCVNDTGATGC